MKIHFFSPPRSIDTKQTVSEMYRSCGNNSGNMVFVNAIADQICYQEATFGYNLNKSEINDQYDAVVIPAANWINTGMDLQEFYNALEGIRKPCIVVGIGAQASDYEDAPVIPDGTRRFLDFVSERSQTISTRGEFSTKLLKELGYDNAVTTGCPSLFWNSSLDLPEIKPYRINRSEDIVFQGTRHNIPNNFFYNSDYHGKQRKAFQYAMRNGFSYVIQSELEEIYYALGRRNNAIVNEEIDEKLSLYYDCSMEDGLYDYLSKRMFFFTDVDSWRKFLTEKDLVITTRIHGCIMALQAGTPALLLWHDSRTREIAEYAGLPNAPFDDFEFQNGLNENTITIDYSRAYSCYRGNALAYAEFLSKSGLPHKFNI